MTWKFSWLLSWSDVWSEDNISRWQAPFDTDIGAHVSPFMHPDLVRAWLNSHGQDRFDPFFFWASHPDGRQAFHLMVRKTERGWRDFTREIWSVGADQFDYCDPVFLPPKDGVLTFDPGFWHTLERDLQDNFQGCFDVLRMPRIRSACLGGAPGISRGEVAPLVRLDPYVNIEAYLQSRSRTFRKSLRRSIGKAQASAEITYISHSGSDIDDVHSWIPAFVQENLRKYPSDYSAEHWQDYYCNLASEGMPSGIVKCTSIMVDGKSASWEFNFTLNDVIYGYSCAFDPAYSRFSLGSVHTFKTIDWAIEQGFQVYDFLWGDEDYKHHWTNGEKTELREFKLRRNAPGSLMRLVAAYVQRKGSRRGSNTQHHKGDKTRILPWSA